MSIQFRRTLHPVGQGAFFTEHFFSDNGFKCNVVYDCGSFTGANRKNQLRAPEILKKEISLAFDKGEHIDYLFLSHFDGDHTNGLNELLSKGLLDDRSHVVIPFKYPYLVMLFDDYYPELAHFISDCIQRHIHIVAVDTEEREGLSYINPERISVNRLLDGNPLSFFVPFLIPIEEPTKKHHIWYYMPFMLPNTNSYRTEFLRQVATLKDVDLNDANSVIVHKEKLKEIYKSIGKKVGHNTKINSNSLLLLSFPPKDIVEETYQNTCCPYIYLNRNPYYEREYIYHIPISCLYTGDVSLKLDFDQVIKLAKETLLYWSDSDEIGIMQIPHHGSANSYPDQLTNSPSCYPICAAFVNCSPYYRPKVFDMDILRKFAWTRQHLYMITYHFSARLEMYAHLRN